MSVMINNLSIPDFRLSPTVDQVGIEERTARFQKRSIKKGSKIYGLKMVLNMIPHTREPFYAIFLL